MAAGGSALARDDDGRVVFVDGALPDELVEAEVFDEHTDYARAAVVQVIEPAEGRVTPPCPYVGAGCGGCGWQHIAPEVQVELKRDIVLDALRRIGRLSSAEVSPGQPLPSTGYRTTVRMGVRDGRAAFHGHRSHELLPIDECLVAHPLLHDLIAGGRYEGATDVTLRCGAATGERLVLASPHAHGVEVPEGVVVIGANEVKKGRTARIHEVVGGRRFLISATSFFQARTDGAQALVDAVGQEFVDEDEAGTFVDAYCGVGLFAGLLGAGRKIVAVERHGPAVRDARDNLGRDAQVVRAEIAAVGSRSRPGRGRRSSPPGPGRQGGRSPRGHRGDPSRARELRSGLPRPGRGRAHRAGLRAPPLHLGRSVPPHPPRRSRHEVRPAGLK